jgi:hypothetical protein
MRETGGSRNEKFPTEPSLGRRSVGSCFACGKWIQRWNQLCFERHYKVFSKLKKDLSAALWQCLIFQGSVTLGHKHGSRRLLR